MTSTCAMTWRPGSPHSWRAISSSELNAACAAVNASAGGMGLGTDFGRRQKYQAIPVNNIPSKSQSRQRPLGVASGGRTPFGLRDAVSEGKTDRTSTGGTRSVNNCSTPPTVTPTDANRAVRGPISHAATRYTAVRSSAAASSACSTMRGSMGSTASPESGSAGKRIVAAFGARTRMRTKNGWPTVTVSALAVTVTSELRAVMSCATAHCTAADAGNSTSAIANNAGRTITGVGVSGRATHAY